MHTGLRPPHDAGDQRHEACDGPDHHPDGAQRNAHCQRRLVVVGDRAQRPAGFSELAEQGQRDHQHNRDHGGPDVEDVDIHAVIIAALAGPFPGHVLPPEATARGQADIQELDLGRPHQVAEAFHEEGESDRGHEQDDRLLIDQVTQDDALDDQRQSDHDQHGQEDRGHRRDVPAEVVDLGPEDCVEQFGERHLAGLQPDQGHRRE